MSSFHSYLSNRISTPDEKSVTTVAWNRVNNLIACGQTNGVITIAKVNYNLDHPGLCKIDINLTLVEHKQPITALCWNERFNKLTSGDAAGFLIVWLEHSGKWRPSMVNDLHQCPIISLCCSNNGELISIIYADGRIVCGDVSGNQKWFTVIHYTPTAACWNPSAKILFIGTEDCQMLMLKSRGSQTVEMEIPVMSENNRVISASWSRVHPHMMLIAFQNGRLLILTSENDVNPTIVDIDMEITDACWSNSGTFIAVSGIVDSGHCQLRFISKSGKHIRTLNVSAQNISSVSFNQTDSQLVIGVDHSICLAQIVPINPWAYFNDTLIYAVDSDENGTSVVFFNSKTGEKHIKKISNLVDIAAGSSSVLLATASPETSQETALLICNQVGIPIASNFMPFLPTLFAVTSHFVVACSTQRMGLWDQEKEELKYFRFKNDATAIAARNSTLFVAFNSGELVMYGLPEFEESARYNLYSTIESIAVSTDLTRLSLIDIYGSMIFLDVHSGTVAGESRKETWCMKWANDSPDLFVSLERQKLYVYRDFEALEPIISLTHICSFSDLVVTAVDFITLYRNPLQPTLDLFHCYESKPLRDVDYLLESDGVSSEEITAYIKSNSHPRLWLMLAETALDSMNLSLAERCFIECQNNPGIQFMKRLSTIPKSGAVQRGFVLWYLKRYDEAEESFRGTDYAVRMYATIGNWHRVAELVNPDDDNIDNDDININDEYNNNNSNNNSGVNKLYIRAHIALGNEAYMQGNWSVAAVEYNLAHDYGKQLRALYRGDDYAGISRLCDNLRPKDSLLHEIGLKFVALGACDKAVEAFLKFGDVQKAIDACVHLNQWNTALQLADEHREVDKRLLMGRYAHHLAENSHIAAAINMFVKFKLPRDAALLLDKEGDLAFKQTRQFLFAKKCYVFAADLLEQSAKEANEPSQIKSTSSLSTTTNSNSNSTTNNSNNNNNKAEAENEWHKAEAVHFLIMAHQQMYAGNWTNALVTAARVFAVYHDVIGKDRSAALLALCGLKSKYLKQCSNGFIQLENSESLSKKKRQRMENMAVRIFGKQPPNDPQDLPAVECKRCKARLVEPNCKCTCGYITTPSIVSGRVVSGGKVWRCSKCRHFAPQEEIAKFSVCPLCHTPTSNT